MKPDTPWFTSSRSAGNGGECVEARRHAGRAEVRDSKDRTGPTLTFSTAQWGTFTTALPHQRRAAPKESCDSAMTNCR